MGQFDLPVVKGGSSSLLVAVARLILLAGVYVGKIQLLLGIFVTAAIDLFRLESKSFMDCYFMLVAFASLASVTQIVLVESRI